jgi:hypothetical protein
MKNIHALVVVCALLGGCSAESLGTDLDEQPATDMGEPLQTIEVGTERLQFFDAGDAGSILISSSKPNHIPRFAVDSLEETAGMQLTPLEVFQALAPEGVEPHERLVSDHFAQTRALGRPDSAVVDVTFKPPAVDKLISPAQCTALLFGTQFILISRNDLGSINMCTANQPLVPQGSCDVWIQTNRHRAGICNNSQQGSALGKATITSNGAGSASTTASVPPNTAQLWTGTPAFNDKLTGFRESKLRLNAIAAFGGGFHARLAPN